jgi:hypothetical protein
MWFEQYERLTSKNVQGTFNLCLIDFMALRLRLWTAATKGHIVHPPYDMSTENDGGMILTGENRRTRRKTCPSATLSTTNPTWYDQGVNPGLRDERPVTNCLSHGRV